MVWAAVLIQRKFSSTKFFKIFWNRRDSGFSKTSSGHINRTPLRSTKRKSIRPGARSICSISSSPQNGRHPLRTWTHWTIVYGAFWKQRSTLPNTEVWTHSSALLGESGRNFRWKSSVQLSIHGVRDCGPVWKGQLADSYKTLRTWTTYIVLSCE
jgi:hypothetical protein